MGGSYRKLIPNAFCYSVLSVGPILLMVFVAKGQATDSLKTFSGT
jgi:hypothetical protein